jgi:PAS domain S-box-containing protein
MLPLMAMPVLVAQAAPGEPPPVQPEASWLHLAGDLATVLGCLSVLAVLLALMARRRDLFDARTGWLLAGFLGALAGTQLLHVVAKSDLTALGIERGLAAAVVIVTALALWLRLPRLFALANPAALAREVEERRAAERRARASEARARDAEARMAAFLANLPEALFVLRVDTAGALSVETVNPAFERMFGVPAAAVSGAPAEALLPSSISPLVVGRWRQVAAVGEATDYEMTVDLPNGQRCWQTVLVPMRGADGRVERLLGSARDVTATRRLQQGLVQSARLATVGTICAGLAHEASQPLNAAALWLRRVRAAAQQMPEAGRAPLMRAAQVVDDQLRRAGDLIGRIRGLAGEEPRGAECFDAGQPVAAALRIAATQYAAEGITLALHGADSRFAVRGRAARLEQAVLQLLSNARDAVLERRRSEPMAPARIEVALRRSAGIVAIEVRDSGSGVPDALAGMIFDPFFTTKEPGRGTGLGLPFAAGVARAMGGGIETWNLPGGGACFRMELAAAEPVAATRAADAHAA